MIWGGARKEITLPFVNDKNVAFIPWNQYASENNIVMYLFGKELIRLTYYGGKVTIYFTKKYI